MKKSLLTIAAALAAMTLSAQSYDYFEFVDKDGNVVPDGTTLTINEVTSEEDIFTGEVINYMYSHLSLRNKTSLEHSLRINLNIDRIDNGSYQLCFPMACKNYTEEINVVTEGGTLAGGQTQDLMTEWVPTDIGGCDVVMTVEILNRSGSMFNPTYSYLADGPTVTLHYRNGIADEIYGDVTGDGEVGIDDVNAIINIMLGKAETIDAADLTGDGSIGIDDVNAVINIMLGK